MQVPALQRPIRASEVSPERLANNPNLSEKEKIAEASRQFEAILLRQILQEGQKPVVHTKLNTDSTAKGIYRDLVTTHLADSISKSGEFGLARTFERQLNGQRGLAPQSQRVASLGSAPAQAVPAGPVAARPPHWPFADSHRLLEARRQNASRLQRAGGAAPALPPSTQKLSPKPGAPKSAPAVRSAGPVHGAARLISTHARTIP
jgi:Rod binding domain-containing protein